MSESVYTTVAGVELVLMDTDDWQRKQDGHKDLWAPAGADWDGPNDPAPISDWPDIINSWNVAKQIKAGFEVWNLSDDRPRYWEKRPAVFRRGGQVLPGHYRSQQKQIETRNGRDADQLYEIPKHKCASVTPEVEAAIKHAQEMHAAAVEAKKAFDAAVKAIPRLSDEEWSTLPVSPRERDAS